MAMGFATVAQETWTRVACATALARSTTAAAKAFQRATATVKATSSTSWAFAGEDTADVDSDGICDDVDDCGCV